MVFHRAILVASAIFLAPGMSAAALAGCGGCGFEAGPAAYAQPFYPEPAPVYASRSLFRHPFHRPWRLLRPRSPSIIGIRAAAGR